MMRAKISVLPPGVYGTISVTGRVGYSSARADSAEAVVSKNAATAAAHARTQFMALLPVIFVDERTG